MKFPGFIRRSARGSEHRHGRPVRVALGIALVVVPTLAGAGPRHVDTFRQDPEFAHHALRTVVILPAVTWDDDRDATFGPPAVWLDVFAKTDWRWVPADVVQLRMAGSAHARDSIFRAVRDQVRKAGAVDAATSRAFCRAFDADAVLCLRVDRWDSKVGGASRTTASLDVHAALVDSAGTELWAIAGRSLFDGATVNAPSADLSSGHDKSTTLPPPSGWTGAIPSSGVSGTSGSSPTAGVAGGMRTMPANAAGSRPATGTDAALMASTAASAGVAPAYRGALWQLFADWASRLPAPPAR